ncbi:hypothetical protein COBT_004287 [Conglomerata obtusa]
MLLIDLKLLLCKGNDAYILLFRLKYANDEQKLRRDWDYSKTGIHKSMLLYEYFKFTISNEKILEKVYKQRKNTLPGLGVRYSLFKNYNKLKYDCINTKIIGYKHMPL